MKRLSHSLAFFVLVASVLTADLFAQRRFGGAYRGPGVVTGVAWSEDGKSVSFTTQGQRYKLDLTTLEREKVAGGGRGGDRRPPRRPGRFRRGRRGAAGNTGRYIGRPTRGRQYTRVDSPDGKWQARYENWNVVLEDKGTGATVQVTTDGDENIHYGTASWVYGEELNERKAMWWSPDSRKLIYYRFDDTKVKPFHLVRGWSKINTEHYTHWRRLRRLRCKGGARSTVPGSSGSAATRCLRRKSETTAPRDLTRTSG